MFHFFPARRFTKSTREWRIFGSIKCVWHKAECFAFITALLLFAYTFSDMQLSSHGKNYLYVWISMVILNKIFFATSLATAIVVLTNILKHPIKLFFLKLFNINLQMTKEQNLLRVERLAWRKCVTQSTQCIQFQIKFQLTSTQSPFGSSYSCLWKLI